MTNSGSKEDLTSRRLSTTTHTNKQNGYRRWKQSIKDRLLRPPFSDDVFVSYSRADGSTYAAGLASRLAGEQFSCRFDQWRTTSGRKIPPELLKALRRSALLVVVCTPESAKSEHVADEVSRFKKTGRDIIPIIFDGVRLSDGICLGGKLYDDSRKEAVAKALWADDIFGAP
jgi:hypothetical protein